MEQGHVDLSHVEILILDEADRMLDMGFIPDLRRIVARVPKKRQTLMFSATMPPEIRKLANEWLVDPVSVAGDAGRVDRRAHRAIGVLRRKEEQGASCCASGSRRRRSTRTLVFARTKHGADKIVKQLLKSRIFAAAIHGNKSQSQRERALAQFKSTRPPVLVATDIAARGIDVDGHLARGELRPADRAGDLRPPHRPHRPRGRERRRRVVLLGRGSRASAVDRAAHPPPHRPAPTTAIRDGGQVRDRRAIGKSRRAQRPSRRRRSGVAVAAAAGRRRVDSSRPRRGRASRRQAADRRRGDARRAAIGRRPARRRVRRAPTRAHRRISCVRAGHRLTPSTWS